MKQAILTWFFVFTGTWSTLVSAQQFYDPFDPESVCINRSIWDNQLTIESKNCFQNSLSSENMQHAYIALGVHLEEIELLDWKTSEFESVNLIMKPLLMAKRFADPDSFLLSYIPFETIRVRPATNHSFVYADDYLTQILLIRMVKRIRMGQELDYGRYAELISVLSEQQRMLLEMASCSKEEWIHLFEDFAYKPSVKVERSVNPMWILDTYRSDFIDFLSNYYELDHFNKLSEEAKGIVLYYWNRNSDQLGEHGKYKILQVLRDPAVNPRKDNLNFQKILLRCILTNCTRDEYNAALDFFTDKAAKARYMRELRMRMEKEYPELYKAPVTKKEVPIQSPAKQMYRPEELITRFDQSTSAELVSYFVSHFNIAHYQQDKVHTNPVVINLRAAIQKLGDMDKNLPTSLEKQIAGIVHQVIDMGLMQCPNCWGEAYSLIVGLGKYAVPTLREEFFSADKARVQFATQLLNELKDKEIVHWLIRVADHTEDEQVKTWSMGWLKIMKEYRRPLMEHRGVSKEESDSIAKEIIDPYLISIGYPKKQ